MNVGRRVDYAVRALTYLAGQRPGEVIARTEIEKNQDIPSHYLSKIIKDPVASGLVHALTSAPKEGLVLQDRQRRLASKMSMRPSKDPSSSWSVLIKARSVVRIAPYVLRYLFGTEPRSLLANYLVSVTISNIADQTGLRERLVSLPG